MSGTQQTALMATGVIWTRWCLIIKPKNYLLASVNFFLGIVAGYQVVRIFNYQKEQGYSTGQALKNLISPPPAKEEGEAVLVQDQQPGPVASAIAAATK